MKPSHSRWLAHIAPLMILVAAAQAGFAPGARAADDSSGSAAPTVTEEAPQVETFSNEKETTLGNDPSGNQFSGFLGLGLGLTAVSGSDEVSKNGILFEGRAAVSMFTKKAIFDLGVSWLYSHVSGSGIDPLTNLHTDASITTQAGTLDFSPRFRLNKTFGLGPMFKVLYGTDTSFSERDQGSTAQVLVGAKAAWDFLEKDVQYRFGLQLLTDLTISNRQVWMPMAFFELGIPFTRGKTILRERETTRVETHRVKIKEIVHQGSTFTFSEDMINFEFNSAELGVESKEFLHQFGEWLQQNPATYGHIKITGHTDSIGSPEYNQTLSENRAKSVAAVLTAAGVPTDRVEGVGLGLTQPVDTNDTEIGRARNRRVEINFGENADMKALGEAMNRIRLRTLKPRTCVGEHCK